MTQARFARYVAGGRLVAVIAGVSILALRWVYEYAVVPTLDDPAVGLGLLCLPLVFVAVGLVVFRILMGGPNDRAPTFLVRGRAFVAPGSPALLGGVTVTWTLLASSFLVPARVLPSGGFLLYNLPVLVLVLLAWLPLLRGPAVIIRPDGLVVRTLRSRTVPWGDLVPVAAPPLPLTVRVPKVALSVRLPGRDRPGWLLVSTLVLAVDPVFLGAAVQHYLDHPEHRAAIGTPEELDRLTATLPVHSGAR